MAFKLPNIKDVMSRKYGTGEYSRTGKKFEQRMKPGESKFQYDVRMRKEGRKATKSESKEVKTSWGTGDPDFLKQDPSAEINIPGADTPSWEYKTQERNSGDLREQSRETITTLPSVPGDKWEYTIDQSNGDIPVLWAKKPSVKKGEKRWFKIEPGSDSDKAIRERYTGSETGGLEDWYGHDTSGWTGSYDRDPITGKTIEETYSSTDIERKSYLPYDLAQKKYNPKYKGSKK